MCGGMVDIHSLTTENRRKRKKKKEEERRKIETTAAKYNGLPCFMSITEHQ